MEMNGYEKETVDAVGHVGLSSGERPGLGGGVGLIGVQGTIETWWMAVSVCLCCYNKTLQTRWLVKNRNFYL